MKTLSLLALVAGVAALAPCAAHAQDFAGLVGDANHAELAGQYRDAAKLYERAYAVSGFDPTALGLAAVSSGHGGDDSSAAVYLRRATSEGLADPRFLRIIETDTALSKIANKPLWRAAVAEAQKKYDALNQPLRATLMDMLARDAANRAGIDSILSFDGPQSPKGDSALKALATADAPLLGHLAQIVTEYGWPGRRLVGDGAAHAACVLVQHAPAEVQEAMLPLIRTAVEHHDTRASDLALLEDRMNVANGKPQMFGTQLAFSDSGGSPKPEPIGDAMCVDARRSEVGLEPLNEYLSHFGSSYAVPPGASPQTCHPGFP